MKIPGDMISLPHLIMPVHQMNQADLKSVIHQLVKKVTGKEKPAYGNLASRPEWWPENLIWTNPFRDPVPEEFKPLTESLRDIVTSCYKHYGQGHLLGGTSISSHRSRTLNDMPSNMESLPGVLRPVQLFKSRASSAVAVKSTSGASRRGDKTFVEIFICFFCEKEFQDKLQLQKHQQECYMRPTGIQLRSPMKAMKPYVPPVVIPRKRPPLRKDPYCRPKFSKFVEVLSLVPKSRAVTKQRNTSIECDIIDLTTEETPRAPVTPKSPRTLISQLSRDMSPAGQSRVSFSHESQGDKFDDSDAESEQSTSEVSSRMKMGKVASLLQIDLCSPLGQRLQKHIVIDKPEKHECDESEHYEHYCRTPIKSESMARLRHRKDLFPNTYRKKRTRDFHYHLYKFNKRQREEFKLKMKTGLTKRARMLVSQMHPCKVLLPKLTETEIEELSKPRPYGFEWARLNGYVPKSKYYDQRGYKLDNSELRHFLGAIPNLSQTNLPWTLFDSINHRRNVTASEQELLRRLGTKNQLHAPAVLNSIVCQQAGPSSGRSSVSHPTQHRAINKNSVDKHQRDDDVISISSNDSDDEDSRSNLCDSRQANKKTKGDFKGVACKTAVRSQTVLFKCHLCAAEILFSLETTEFIRRHFADKHGVRNIRIMEQKDSTGQLVLSIVEDPPSRPSLNQSANNKANIQKTAQISLDRLGGNSISSRVSSDDVICIDD